MKLDNRVYCFILWNVILRKVSLIFCLFKLKSCFAIISYPFMYNLTTTTFDIQYLTCPNIWDAQIKRYDFIPGVSTMVNLNLTPFSSISMVVFWISTVFLRRSSTGCIFRSAYKSDRKRELTNVDYSNTGYRV